MELQENRFKTIIQPIKDLAANWDIDIADSLNDYLEELSTLRISLDEGQTNLNFAEAALLIQGSAAIYSKKVEYLYQLVVQSIEFISKKKSNVLSKGKKGEDNSLLEDEVLLFGSDPSFLLLDHVIEEGTNIDMDLPNVNDQSHISNESFQSASALNMSQLNVSLLHSALHDDHGGTFLKLASSNIDENGALQIGSFRPMMTQSMFVVPQSSNLFAAPPSTAAPDSFHDNQQTDSIPMDIGMDDEYGGDYGGGDNHWEPDYPLHNQPAARSLPSDATAPLAANKPKPSRPESRPSKVYVLLDPHAVMGGSRPAKKGRTFRLPQSLSKRKNDPVFDPVEELFNEYWKQDSWKETQNNRPSRGGLHEPCLLPLLKARKTIEKRVQAQQRFKKAANNDVDSWGDDVHADYFEENADPMMNMIYGYHDRDDAAIPPVVDAMDNQLLQQYEADYDAPDVNYVMEDVDGPVLPGDEDEDLARRVEAALQNDNNYQHNYEMICKQFIDNFHRGAEAFARESQLSKRVNEWTYKLEPILQAQEEAKPFDIHQCSDEVLNKLSVETKVLAKSSKPMEKKKLQVPFQNIAEGESSAEVCRKFLACLQLANLGNVEIVARSHGKQVDICNDFQLKLLSETRVNEIENFRAPSLVA